MISGPITSWQIDGETMETVTDFIFGGLQNHCRWWLQPWNQKTLAPWKKSYDKPRQHIKKQRRYFANKGPSSQSFGFSSSQVWMWELDHKKSWALKNWCFWTVILEKILERPLDCKEIQPVNPKGTDPWEETLMLGKIEGGRRRGWQRVRWSYGITDSMDRSWWWTGKPGVLQSMGLQRVGHDWATELNSFFRGSCRPRNQTGVFCIAGRFFTSGAKGKPF